MTQGVCFKCGMTAEVYETLKLRMDFTKYEACEDCRVALFREMLTEMGLDAGSPRAYRLSQFDNRSLTHKNRGNVWDVHPDSLAIYDSIVREMQKESESQ